MEDKFNSLNNSDTAPQSEGYTDDNAVEELDKEIALLQQEIDTLLAGGSEEEKEEEPTEVKSSKRGDLVKAVKEKNKIIRELKEKIKSLNESMKRTGEEEVKEVKTKEVEEETNPLEVQQRIAEINQKCNELEQKYKDAPIPFDRVNVLLEVYKKTGGVVNDLSIIEDIYLASLHKYVNQDVNEARKQAKTETPSGQGSEVRYTPKNLEEAFEILKRKNLS